MSYSSLHCHDDYSNASLGFTDSINKYDELIKTAYDLGLYGIAITNHEIISDHIKALKYYKSMNLERPFKLILGNEIYLLSEEEDAVMRGEFNEDLDEEATEEETESAYYHFILNALDNEGHKQIRELSSRAWDRAYVYKGMMRRPTYYSDLVDIIDNNKGHIVGSTACLGGVIPKLIIDWKIKGNEKSCQKLQNIIEWFDNLFGHGYFFLETQPCLENNNEQIVVNQTLVEIGKYYDIDVIVTTDAHYLNREQAFAHKVLLNSKDGGKTRETEDFYATTYLMSEEELKSYLSICFDDEQIEYLLSNTNKIADMVKDYNFEHAPMIPQIPTEKIPSFEISHRYKEYYSKYPNFAYYANINAECCPYNSPQGDSSDLISKDKYFFYRIENALYNLVEMRGKDTEKYISRLNDELNELKLISEAFNDSMASYYTTMSQIINLIWESDSFSMPARGSGAGFLVCYLLEITQIDPVPLGDYFPYWRHLSAERGVEIAD